MSYPTDQQGRIVQLLAELNEWVFGRGGMDVREGRTKSSGEANARIAQIEQDLHVLGASYHRDGDHFTLNGTAKDGTSLKDGSDRP